MNSSSPTPETSEEAPYLVRLARDSDAPAVRELFRRVFGKDMSQALWDWKYAHQAGHAALVFQEGELVAHYGGIGRDTLWAGEWIKSVQICDVMVSPTVRNAVRGNSPFRAAVESFGEHLVGYHKPYLLAFGFPNDRHMKLAEILGLYAPVGDMTETSWQVEEARLPLTASATVLDPGNFHRHAPALDRLWRRMARDLDGGLVTLRDAAYLRRRYLEHPERNYELRLLRHRLSRRPLGLVALRHDDGQSLLLDVVGGIKDMPRLLECARALARHAGNRELKAWSSAPFAGVFRGPGANQQRLPIITPGNTCTPGPDPATYRDKWWLTAGDTDFQ